jgi:hypothetical protein
VLPTGEIINDLSVGKYDVEIVVGPSYATKRMEAAESMMAFVQAIPQAGAVAGDLIAKSLDWPGAEAIAERLKKMLPPGLAEDKGEQPAPPPPPDPIQVAEAQAKQADAEKKQAEADGVRLDNAKKELELAAVTGGIQDMVAAEVQRVIMAMMQPDPMQQQLPPPEPYGQPITI